MTKILLDASNAWYRSYLATVLSPPGGAVMIMTYMLRKLCLKYGRSNVIVCWDGGDGGRKALDSGYKGQRTSRPNVWEDIVYMYKMVDCLGIPHCQVNDYEADDVIGSLAVQDTDNILIHSYDKDFYQLVNDKINVFRPERNIGGKKIPEQIIEVNDVIKEFGCKPDKVVTVKAFKGDASDNIPKISIRFTKNFTEQFYSVIQKTSGVADVYENLNLFDEKYHEALKSFKDRALLNEKLIRINTTLKIKPQQAKQDLKAFELLCAELEITKLKASDWRDMPLDESELPPVQNLLF